MSKTIGTSPVLLHRVTPQPSLTVKMQEKRGTERSFPCSLLRSPHSATGQCPRHHLTRDSFQMLNLAHVFWILVLSPVAGGQGHVLNAILLSVSVLPHGCPIFGCKSKAVYPCPNISLHRQLILETPPLTFASLRLSAYEIANAPGKGALYHEQKI